MRSLLTGYAGAFNRHHKRTGHLFQNRYRSIVVEEEPYLLELVRYIHLNPLRGGEVPDLRALDRYPWTGHSTLLGHSVRPWQEVSDVLGRFAADPRTARHRYRVFVAGGIALGRWPELQGGGLLRSQGGWVAVASLRHGREAYASDERILGGSVFVETLRHEVEQQEARRRAIRQKVPDLATLLKRIAAAKRLLPEALLAGSRSRVIAPVRDGLAYLWVEALGRSGSELARALSLRPESVYRAARRGRERADEWTALLDG